MRQFARRKLSLKRLTPPEKFTMTIADVARFAGGPLHAEKVRDWARAAWDDWRAAHDYIREWANTA